MIIWIHGNSGAGKTYLAKEIQKEYGGINLDGDDLRFVWTDLGFSKEDRIENNYRFFKLARLLEDQGHDIIISTIFPYRSERVKVKELFPYVQFIELLGGKETTEEYPYEPDIKEE